MGDMARYAAGRLNGGVNGHGPQTQPDTLARMFEPNFPARCPLPRHGPAFFRDVIGGQLTASHDGNWKGFLSDMVLSPPRESASSRLRTPASSTDAEHRCPSQMR